MMLAMPGAPARAPGPVVFELPMLTWMPPPLGKFAMTLQITLDFEGEAGRGKHPILFADAVCNLSLDSISLWVLGYPDADGNKTTNSCAAG